MIDPLPSDIFRAGEVLNNTYEIEGVLGRGGTGEVYRVVNKVTGRIFAIKALNAEFSKNEDYVGLMKREEEMRHIIHDSVVRYNECSRTDKGNVILVMDYIEGPSLAEAMVLRQLSEKELLIVGHRIAQGLVAAHGHGIVHRDLSPDNIILRDGAPEKATLIDFGIAKDTAVGARTIVGNEFAGKYEYAAPEQLDGKAEARSDIYALGATLLAAYRGETPYLGTTPGEIVRRKQARLDVEGVPDGLKRLVEAFCNPVPGDRPADASATVAFIDELLEDGKPSRGKAARTVKTKAKTRRSRKRSPFPLVLTGLAVLVLAVGAYVVTRPSLPTVAPYTLSASKGVSGRTMMTGHAPDEETSQALVTAFASASGAPREAATITLAEGMPDPAWAADLQALLDILANLQSWELSVSDVAVSLSGLASDVSAVEAARGALQSWQAGAGFSLEQRILAGPETLSAGAMAGVLESVRTCGPLEVVGDRFPLGARVPVTGVVANRSDATVIKDALAPVIGSRVVDTDVTVLNPDLCAIRDVLPATDPGAISIWLGNGEDGSVNLTGVFNTGDNPVVDVLVPSDQTGVYLWVMVVDNTGKVFHVLPNINDTEQIIEQLGLIEGGLRRVPVLFPRSALAEDPGKLVVEVTEGNYGKSEVIAFLTRHPLFDVRRPREESTASVKEALTEAITGRESDIISVATRIIEARQ